MAFSFTEQHAYSLVAPYLQPGEQLLQRARGVEKPWWTRVFSRMGSLFWRYYLVVATDQRLIMIKHGGLFSGYGAKGIDSLYWSQIDRAELGWGIFRKNLHISATAQRFTRKIEMPRFWMKKNFDASEAIVQTWTRSRSLPPGPQQYASLPPAPQQPASMAPAPQQYAQVQPASQQYPSMPPAPQQYPSVPPPSYGPPPSNYPQQAHTQQSYGIAPLPQPQGFGPQSFEPRLGQRRQSYGGGQYGAS